MAQGVFNVAKGRVVELATRVVDNDPADSALVVVLLKSAVASVTLQDYTDMATLLSAAGNVEADFTNYARKVVTDAELSVSPTDLTNDKRTATVPEQLWEDAGGTTDNTLAVALIGYTPDAVSGTDADIVPLTYHDFVYTTTGGGLKLRSTSSDVFFEAS